MAEFIKHFHFTDETDIIDVSCSSSDSLCSASEQHVCNQQCLNIKIKEVLHPSFGMYVWACAPVLGKYVWHNRIRLKGKVTLELGSGTGFISVIATKCGAHAIITDSQKYSSTFKTAEENMKINCIEAEDFEVQELTWGYFTPFLIKIRHVDIIFGSDVFYCPKDFEDVIVTVSYLLRRNTNTEFWCAYEHRWNKVNPLDGKCRVLSHHFMSGIPIELREVLGLLRERSGPVRLGVEPYPARIGKSENCISWKNTFQFPPDARQGKCVEF